MENSNVKIEVNVISAEGLLINRKQPLKRKSGVVIKSDPFNCQSTGLVKEGGNYPVWNEKLLLDVPAGTRFVTAEVHSGRIVVGSANIPVSDFLGGYLPENYLSFLSYRLRDVDGYKNGIINLSVRVKGTGRRGGDTSSADSCLQPSMSVATDGKVADDHGVVLGIPVGYNNWQ